MHDQLGLFINGTWRTETAKGEAVINPADESELGRLPHAGPGDLEDALQAAKAGFQVWRKTPATERGAFLERVAGLIAEARETLARIITLEQGKPLAEALGEVDRAVETFQWNAEQAPAIARRLAAERGPDVKQ